MKRNDKLNDYAGFVEKFKPKLTTDDCYTPPEVYEIIKNWVHENIASVVDVPIVRPFYPGGDYENFDYPQGCIVLDNPPFSIIAKIRKFYNSRGIKYFLFAPGLTLFSSPLPNETYIVANASIVYENGACVSTGFVTNLTPGTRIWVTGAIKNKIDLYQSSLSAAPPKYKHSDFVVTPATLNKICKVKDADLKIPAKECFFVRHIDSMRRMGKTLFGGGFLISERAAAERAAAERAAAERAAAERAAAERVIEFPLSDAEWEIVKGLK